MIAKIIYKKNYITGEVAEFMDNSIIADPQNWYDITIDEYSNSRIQFYRDQKINECKKFYDDLRYINAKNGHEVIIKCDSQFSDGLRNEIDRMRGNVDKFYNYIYNKDIIVDIPLSECERLLPFIANIRSQCFRLSTYHIAQISDLQTKNDIDNYNYKVNVDGTPISKFPDFIIQTINKENV